VNELAPKSARQESVPNDSLTFLNPQQVARIDRALEKVGPFGEVRLVVVKGRLRFIQIMHSEDVES
jgi:hypothetical protein